jgi:DNA-binding transcriptional MerR regulator
MTIMAGRGEWTLSEAARLLGTPQHRLIYLCEKGVVHPDLEDAKGRGSSRRFSARNLLEFAIALRLRALDLPAPVVGAITYTLRAFERQVQQQQPTFRLPESLRGAGAPDLRAMITDGCLYMSLRTANAAASLYGGVDLKTLVGHTRSPKAVQRALARSALSIHTRQDGANGGGPAHDPPARVEISVTRVAQELRLEA